MLGVALPKNVEIIRKGVKFAASKRKLHSSQLILSCVMLAILFP